jgi:hypothetical protein
MARYQARTPNAPGARPTTENGNLVSGCHPSRRLAGQKAAGMVDYFKRIFLRTLRALCDLRRNGPKVIVKKGGQLNVAEQQVNVAGGGTG